LSGNMLSRWTNFLTEDGEKDWRDRDSEFESVIKTKEELKQKWEAGWQCVFSTLESLKENDLDKTIFIRKEPQMSLSTLFQHHHLIIRALEVLFFWAKQSLHSAHGSFRKPKRQLQSLQ